MNRSELVKLRYNCFYGKTFITTNIKRNSQQKFFYGFGKSYDVQNLFLQSLKLNHLQLRF